MSLEILLQELTDSDEKKRLRAIYQLGIRGESDTLAALQAAAETDAEPELRSVARATIRYIQQSPKERVVDAKADVEFTRQFMAFLQRSTRFSPADIEDLAQETVVEAEAVLASPAAASPLPTPPSPASQPGTQVIGTYQMFWDCPACGAKKLLGVTHRFCPNCGTVQDPKLRYFPAPGEEVALENHVYYGVDIVCPACETPNSARANFCVNCGADLKAGTRAALKQDQIGGEFHEDRPDLIKERFEADMRFAAMERAERARQATLWGRHSKKIISGAIGIILFCISGGLFASFWKFDEEVTVAQHSWQRLYQIEEYSRVHETRDCPAPSGAYNVTRRTEQRSRQVPDGQTCREVCSDQRVDQGDGSFRTERRCRQECETKYRTEYYSVEVCSYNINRWLALDEEDNAPWAIASGNNTSPVWPDIESRNVPHCDNAARQLGQHCWEKREATYKLHLKRDNGKEAICEIEDESEWRSFADGQRVKVKFTLLGRATNKATCDSIQPTR